MFGLKRKEAEIINRAAKALPAPQPEPVASEPPKITAPEASLVKSRVEELAEYAKVAGEIGLAVPTLEIEAFVAVLERLNFPVYSLDAVRAYMDDKASREGDGWGWQWNPLREKDRFSGWFGTAAARPMWQGAPRTVASDHYSETLDLGFGMTIPRRLYSRIVPIHALKRVAAIEKEHTKPVHFLVTDYVPQPAFRADPFLMAIIPNPHLNDGVGRFVIDFWDEPGFGIDKMLA